MQLLRKISNTLTFWQTTIMLSVVYYVIVVPVGFLYRISAHTIRSGWQPWSCRSESIEDLRQQS